MLLRRLLIRAAALALAASFAAVPARALTLVHSNDVLGELEPCGCRKNPLGGISRRLNLARKLPADAGPFLRVDAGDLLFATLDLPEALRPQAELQARHLLRALDAEDWDFVVPGEKDFALGTRKLKELLKGVKTAFLAANLRDAQGRALFDGHRIVRRGGLRIAVVGVVGEKLVWPKDVKATPAIEAARREVARARGGSDYVVLVSHQGIEADRALLAAVPGIDLLVGAHSQSFLQQPEKLGASTIVQSSFRNQYAGLLRLSPAAKGKGKRAEADWENYRLADLGAEHDSPADAPNAVDSIVAEFKREAEKLNLKLAADGAHAAESAGGARAAPAFQTFPRCAECHLKQFDFFRRTRHGGSLPTLAAADALGNKECLGCHSVGFAQPKGWRELNELGNLKAGETEVPLEAPALARLLKALHEAKDLNAKVDLPKPDGKTESVPVRQVPAKLGRVFGSVQCESCHLAGGEHPFGESVPGKTFPLKVATTSCLGCHTPARAPSWFGPDGKEIPGLVDKKLAQVRCPAGDLGDSD